MSLPLRWEESVLPETPSVVTKRKPKRRRSRSPLIFRLAIVTCLVGVLIILASIGAVTVWQQTTGNPGLKQLSPAVGTGQVALASVSINRHLGFVTVVGTAASHAAKKLKNVEAVIELLDSNHRTVQIERAMLVYDVLHPGEASPFRIEVPDDSRAVAYRVGFRELMGESLN